MPAASRATRLALTAAALTCASPALAQNLLLNNSFEIPGPGFVLFEDWGHFNNTFADDNIEVTAQDGVRSVKTFGQFIPGGQSDNGVYQIVPATGGTEYTLSCWTLSLSTDPLEPFVTVPSNYGHLPLLIMDFKDANGVVLDSAVGDAFIPGVDPLDTWIQRSVTGVAPAGTVEMQVTLLLIQFDEAPGSLFWDNAELTEGSGGGPCAADMNNDGILDFFDVLTFLQAFSDGCP
ncbi:MAG: hypothetical protein D6695_06595 [Planctomycetota bacterium]|nr:MAG: hypothetical protein D6695_06595 [Planctomycetota bacterium]